MVGKGIIVEDERGKAPFQGAVTCLILPLDTSLRLLMLTPSRCPPGAWWVK